MEESGFHWGFCPGGIHLAFPHNGSVVLPYYCVGLFQVVCSFCYGIKVAGFIRMFLRTRGKIMSYGMGYVLFFPVPDGLGIYL